MSIVKKFMHVKKIMFRSYYIWKHLASIMDHSAILCGEVIKSYYEEIKTISTSFN